MTLSIPDSVFGVAIPLALVALLASASRRTGPRMWTRWRRWRGSDRLPPTTWAGRRPGADIVGSAGNPRMD